MKFRPCIDLHDGKVKQIVGSTLTDSGGDLVENFVSGHDSAYYAELFRQDRLKGGHIIMLGPGNETAAKQALRAYPGGMHVGGGINADNAADYLEAGASHVIVTSYVFKNGEISFANLDKMVAAIGKERLVLDLSCRMRDGVYYVVTDRWQKFTNCEVNERSMAELAGYCDEFLIHAVDVEGKNAGVQEDLVRALGNWVTIPATYAGGARSIDDLALVRELGQGKLDVTVGSALDLFGGKLPYREVVDYCR